MTAVDGFSSEERAAMKEAAAELRTASKRRGASKEEKAAAEAQDVTEKIAGFAPDDRALAERIAAIVADVAPALAPRLWYGMPAWSRDGKVVCFFQDAAKFKARYATLGFNDSARLDDGALWPTAFALTALGDAEQAVVAELIRRAAG